MPFLVLASLVGLTAFARWYTTTDRRGARVATVDTLLVLGGFGLVVNGALGLLQQRPIDPNAPPGLVTGFVGFQTDVDDHLFGDPAAVARVDVLPTDGSLGDLVVVGECDGLYVNNGQTTRPWRAVERTRATGGVTLRVVFPDDVEPGQREPLLSAGEPGMSVALGVEYLGDDQVAFGYWSDATGAWRTAEPVTVEPGREYELDAVLDPRTVRTTSAARPAPS